MRSISGSLCIVALLCVADARGGTAVLTFLGVDPGQSVHIIDGTYQPGGLNTTAGQFDWTTSLSSIAGIPNGTNVLHTYCVDIINNVANGTYQDVALSAVPSPGGPMDSSRVA